MKNKIKTLVIGGGTGSSAVLNGLKRYAELDLTVVVSMADDGGSNAVIRDEFGLLPLSDLRKSIIALSPDESDQILREMFIYRFSDGEGLRGHTLGNLMMTALSKISGSERDAVKIMSELFNVKGKILAGTYEKHDIEAIYGDGNVITGQHKINEPPKSLKSKIVSFSIKPSVEADHEVIESISKADYIIIGPGDIYTTTLCNLALKGVTKAVKNSNARLIYIANLISKNGQTRNRTQREIVEIIESYTGRKLDYIFINKEQIPRRVVKHYSHDGEHILKDDLGEDPRVIRENLIAHEIFEREAGDDLVRSIVRHDSDVLGWSLYKLMKEENFVMLK